MTTIDSTDEKKPFMVRCGKCEHRWAAGYTPMEMGLFGKILKGVRCPQKFDTTIVKLA